MNSAVHKGADPNRTFVEYVDYFANASYIPPDARPWVDHIRLKGNNATHEINAVNRPEAKKLFAFTTMLLRLIYELPATLNEGVP